jgi:NAD(P)-dependent dehydrogenase (short-subunit alcohol dehydrogenase family)
MKTTKSSVALVTGGNRGLGLQTALELGRNSERLVNARKTQPTMALN